MKRLIAAIVLMPLAFGAQAFGQATGTLGGTVEDPTGALIPGAEVVAVNQETNVETLAVTNDAGAYNFLATQPGDYTVRAVMPNFQTVEFTDVSVSANQATRLNFTLEVAAQAAAVEVSVSADQLLLEASPSVGEALEADEIVALPNVTNNVLELVNVMAGVTRQTEGFVLGLQGDFAGVSANNINVMRDGISVNDQRFQQAGLNSATYMNQDMVGEMRMVLAPVDAETGRGNGQVQITTRSGGNEFHGSAVWNVRNSALDSRTWEDNSQASGPPTIPWINQNQYTISAGGPIVRNRTFFFALWDQNISKSRTTTIAQVLTPCMQRGIFRYWDNWINGPADQSVSTGANPIRPSVDASGNPLPPATNPDGTPHNQILRHVSLFGQVSGTPTADCSGMTIAPAPTATGSWDPFRTGFDTSGVYDLLASRAPEANTFERGESGAILDGLNIVGHRWTRTVDGRDNWFGVGEPNPRKQINLKIDHIFSPNHKLAASYSYEKVNADDTYEGWADSYEGRLIRRPQVMSINMTSTLAANVVNEARFGMSRSGTNVTHATSLPDGRGEELLDLLPKTTGGLPVLTQWCTPAGFFDPATMSWCGQNGGLIGARGNGPSATDVWDTSPRWTFADTLSWTSGRHAFKFGATYIRASSNERVAGSSINDHAFPVVFLGGTSLAPADAFDAGNLSGWRAMNADLAAGLHTTNSDRMNDLLIFLSGSLDRIEQGRFINRPDQVGTSWNDAVAGEIYKERDLQQREFNLFVKDDWKVTDNLTLNLGLRWDYYGVPWDANGLSLTIRGGGDALFGRSGMGFENWLLPGERGGDVEFIFVGPNSPNPDLMVHPRDLNNFGPAVGFSYSIPWLGRDRTVFRGGYQLSYLGGGQGAQISGIIQNPPGSAVQGTFEGLGAGQYFDMQDVVNGVGVPADPTFLPVLPVPVTDRNADLTVYAPNYSTPYIQNLTASLTHTFSSTLTLDLRYIGTLSRKMSNSFNLNVANIHQNGLFEAFEAARRGGESALLDDLFHGINMKSNVFAADAIVGRNGLTGAEFLRTDSRFNQNLARGAYVPIADLLNDLNYVSAYNPNLSPIPTGVQGGVLRASGFPENYIYTSPQFDDANLRANMGYRNYHSMQAQLTVRPIWGIQNTFSYTWSKNLGNTGGYTVPWERWRDYRLSGRAHSFRSFGTFSLPIGPNQLLLGNSSGLLARVAEGWQVSWIYNASSGVPQQVAAFRGGWYSNNYPVLVDGATFDASAGQVNWPGGDDFGTYFTGYERQPDPQCSNSAIVAPSLQGLCDLNALYDSGGNLVFRTPLPGEFGNFRDQIFAPGRWDLDMALSKRIQVTEGISMEVRVDATNVFNHPHPQNPNLSIQSGDDFGVIDGKNGVDVEFSEYGRVFKARVRVDW